MSDAAPDFAVPPPWAQLPRELAELFRPYVARLADEMIAEIQRGVPEYARPLDDAYSSRVRESVESALDQFISLIGDPEAPWEAVAAVFREIGRIEAREGRDLEALQHAMRLGARVAWRRIAIESEQLDVSRSMLGRLAEAIFAFLDEIADAATEGHTEVRRELADELELQRQRLLDLLLSEPSAAARAIGDLARLARWPLPQTVAAVAVEEPARTSRPPPKVLSGLDRPEPCLLIPDPGRSDRARLIEMVIPARSAATIGPAVAPPEAGRSLRWALKALTLTRRGVLPADRPTHCLDHMPALVMFQEEELIKLVAADRLAPLETIRPGHRDQLARTMLAFLQCSFNATKVAGRLHIHPQTARYRLRQLEELFGDVLYDPDLRLELEMLLHVRLAGRRSTP